MQGRGMPLLVSGAMETGVSVNGLSRCDLKKKGEAGYNERWVQELVHKAPSVLPIIDTEPSFFPVLSVCMELPLASGYLDNLLITPTGDIIAVECKLWRNGEARREVIAQIIDYAKDLQALSFEDFQDAIREARKEPKFNLHAFASEAIDEGGRLEEQKFVDTVSRNLRRGRFLLLIVGDGITENARGLTEFLQQHAGLHFSLAMVELAVHEMPEGGKWLVVPSVPLRTETIVRGIVQFESGAVAIAAPPRSVKSETPSTLSEESLFEALDRKRPGTTEQLIAFLASCDDLNVHWEVVKHFVVRMTSDAARITVFVINPDGLVDMGYAPGMKTFYRAFVEKVVAAVPGTVAKETEKSVFAKKANGSLLTVWDLLDNSSGIRLALEALRQQLETFDETQTSE